MSKVDNPGGGSWGFGECCWAPIKTKGNTCWPFWTNVARTREGDVVIHLKGKAHPAFVGFSITAEDGYRTAERSPSPGDWDFAQEFFRLSLRDFTRFEKPKALDGFLRTNEAHLRTYLRGHRQTREHENSCWFYRSKPKAAVSERSLSFGVGPEVRTPNNRKSQYS